MYAAGFAAGLKVNTVEYLLIALFVAVVIASIVAIRPSSHERLLAFIRNQALTQGWKVRLIPGENIDWFYPYPLLQPVVCYSKNFAPAIGEQLHPEWGYCNQGDANKPGGLGKKYIAIEQKTGQVATIELHSQHLDLVDSLFQQFGEHIYGIKYDQSGLFCYWDENIDKLKVGDFLNMLSRFIS